MGFSRIEGKVIERGLTAMIFIKEVTGEPRVLSIGVEEVGKFMRCR